MSSRGTISVGRGSLYVGLCARFRRLSVFLLCEIFPSCGMRSLMGRRRRKWDEGEGEGIGEVNSSGTRLFIAGRKESRGSGQISTTLVLLKRSRMPGRVAGDAAGLAVPDDAVVARTLRAMPGQSGWREFRCPWRRIRPRIVSLLVQTHRGAETRNFTLHSARGWGR